MINPEVSRANIAKLSDPNRGRLVAAVLSEDENNYRLFCGMGGRSAGSKNRYYQQVPDLNDNGSYIRTAVHDLSIQTGDPSATLYVAQRSWGGWHVASNGEQTEGIAIALALGNSFYDGQRLYKNEREQNGFTARISVAAHRIEDRVFIGKILSRPDNPDDSDYLVYTAGIESDFPLEPGEGYYTVTYDGMGELGPNREDPWPVLFPGSLEDNMDLLWNNWDPNTRGNLVGKEIDRMTGQFRYSFRSIHPGRA